MYNRNKRSLAVDLKSDEGREILWALIRKSDGFVQNLGPGAVERLGFGWDAVDSANQRWSTSTFRATGAAIPGGRTTAWFRRPAG